MPVRRAAGERLSNQHAVTFAAADLDADRLAVVAPENAVDQASIEPDRWKGPDSTHSDVTEASPVTLASPGAARATT